VSAAVLASVAVPVLRLALAWRPKPVVASVGVAGAVTASVGA
jgi:hypothetical protein